MGSASSEILAVFTEPKVIQRKKFPAGRRTPIIDYDDLVVTAKGFCGKTCSTEPFPVCDGSQGLGPTFLFHSYHHLKPSCSGLRASSDNGGSKTEEGYTELILLNTPQYLSLNRE